MARWHFQKNKRFLKQARAARAFQSVYFQFFSIDCLSSHPPSSLSMEFDLSERYSLVMTMEVA